MIFCPYCAHEQPLQRKSPGDTFHIFNCVRCYIQAEVKDCVTDLIECPGLK